MAPFTFHRAAATLEDFLGKLKLDASEAFVVALAAVAAQRAFEQQRNTTNYLNQFVAVQNHPFKAGDIGETNLTGRNLTPAPCFLRAKGL